MSKASEANTNPVRSKTQETQGEAERDNDAHRPDGSAGTSHDSTAQQVARGKGRRKP